MKTILVPTDFSPLSLQALEVAVQLAKPTNASIVLFHAVEFSMPSAIGDGTFPSIATQYDIDSFQISLDAAKDQLEKVKKQPKFKMVDIKTEVESNLEGIDRTIAYHKADLIVMGSTGAKGVKEMLWGSHAEGVVRRAKCPVLVIKKPTKEIKLAKVLFATDFQQTKFVKKALDLLGLTDLNSWLHFVCVNTPMNFNGTKNINQSMEKLAGKLQLLNYQFIIYNAFSEEKGILEYADAIKADLIIMPTHGRTGLSHALYGSIAEDVVNHSKCPVLTLVE
ncbi:MAG: universal stress protein [Spirosomataceae bacterium]|mgnify:CR=1 FL=1